MSVPFTPDVSCVSAAQDDQPVPTESECRPYIEKALKQLGTSDAPPGELIMFSSSEAPSMEVKLLEACTVLNTRLRKLKKNVS
jgi:hypothetical protein